MSEQGEIRLPTTGYVAASLLRTRLTVLHWRVNKEPDNRRIPAIFKSGAITGLQQRSEIVLG
jgi:hypothetical protein